MQKRFWLRTAALTVVSAAALVACGKKEEPKPVEAPKAEAKPAAGKADAKPAAKK